MELTVHVHTHEIVVPTLSCRHGSIVLVYSPSAMGCVTLTRGVDEVIDPLSFLLRNTATNDPLIVREVGSALVELPSATWRAVFPFFT